MIDPDWRLIEFGFKNCLFDSVSYLNSKESLDKFKLYKFVSEFNKLSFYKKRTKTYY